GQGRGPGRGRPRGGELPPAAALNTEREDLYSRLGDDYRIANQQAFDQCGRDYANYSCICPRTHAIVISLVGQQIGDPKKIPNWLQQQHCSGAAGPTQGANGLTSYQQILVGAATDYAPTCPAVLVDYFTGLDAPANGEY